GVRPVRPGLVCCRAYPLGLPGASRPGTCAPEELCRLRSPRCRGEDRASVIPEQPEPVRQVLRMVGAKLLGDPEFGTEEGGAYFCDQFLGCIGFVAETFAHVAVQAMFGAGP